MKLKKHTKFFLCAAAFFGFAFLDAPPEMRKFFSTALLGILFLIYGIVERERSRNANSASSNDEQSN
jgi:hypothetical protein